MGRAGLDAVKMLFSSTVLNGLPEPLPILLILLFSSNGDVMSPRVNFTAERVLGWITLGIMTARRRRSSDCLITTCRASS